MKLSKFTNIIEIENGIILHNAIYNSCVKVYAEKCINIIKKLELNGNMNLDSNVAFIKDLIDLKLIVANNYNEENILTYCSNTANRKNEFTLIVTKQCNFRCPYCYEDHTNDIMSWETYSNTLKFMESILNCSNSKYGVISFFGGEPLLEYKNIVKFMKEFKSMLSRINDGRTWTGHITTNAYLLELNIVKQLESVGVNSYQITVDGLKENHDKSRYLAEKVGSWDKIIHNLEQIKNSDLNISLQIRMNYTMQSLTQMDEYINFLIKNFNDDRFHFYFEAVKDYGVLSDNDGIEICRNESDIQEYVTNIAKNKGLKLSIMKTFSSPFGIECYASNPRSFVIDYDGSIEKCTILLNTDEKNIIGNVNNKNNFDIDIEKLSNWTSYNLKDMCKDCSAVGVCNGRKCPANYESTEIIDDNYCGLVKKIYKESVKLNYM